MQCLRIKNQEERKEEERSPWDPLEDASRVASMEEATRAAWDHHLKNIGGWWCFWLDGTHIWSETVPRSSTCQTSIHSSTWLSKQHPNPHLLLLAKLIQADWARGVGRRCPGLPPLKRKMWKVKNVRKLQRPGCSLLAWAFRSTAGCRFSRWSLNV